MKKIIVASLLLSAQAFAHGPVAKQAADAVNKATDIFVVNSTPEVRKQFAGISAVLTGHEMFAVTIVLKDKTELTYTCHENEEVEPVVWECQ